MTTLFCAVIHTCYFADFNHRSGLNFSIFMVVLILVNARKSCFVCACVSAYDSSSLSVPVIQCCAIFSTTATRRWNKQQATNPGPKGKEPRANRNVTDRKCRLNL